MGIRLIPGFLIGVLLGIGLGFVPFVNEHLHWNVWFILPISGLLFGVLAAYLQFLGSYALRQQIKGLGLLWLSVGALFGFAATDYGVYLSTTIAITEMEGIPDGEYRLVELISFWDYMKLRLGSSSLSSTYGGGDFELGRMGTTLSYVVDLLGAWLGAWGTLIYLAGRYPYCERCSIYKKRERKYRVLFKFDERLVEEVFGRLQELIRGAIYPDLVKYCQELAQKHNDRNGNINITVDQRFCPRCREATLLGSVSRLAGSEWKELDDLSFSFSSQRGERVSLKNMGG